MTPFHYLRNFQNIFSFALRSQVRFKKGPSEGSLNTVVTAKLREELSEFLDLFEWQKLKTRKSITAVDIGCRDFSFAPVYEKKMAALGVNSTEIHGVEIDAFRRYRNFCSRADYGRAFARQIRNGHYHAQNFLDWNQPVDVAFLLHPFVTPEPPVRWGLPLSTYRPQELFNHCSEILKERDGVLLLSNPSVHEYEISLNLARAAGFRIIEEARWQPSEGTVHQKPRLGAIFRFGL